MTQPLTDDAIASALAELPGWARDGEALAKTFEFDDFKQAFGFMTRVAFEAEATGHHPDWSNVYRTVTIRLNTHDAAGRVTQKDVDLARAIQGLV